MVKSIIWILNLNYVKTLSTPTLPSLKYIFWGTMLKFCFFFQSDVTIALIVRLIKMPKMSEQKNQRLKTVKITPSLSYLRQQRRAFENYGVQYRSCCCRLCLAHGEKDRQALICSFSVLQQPGQGKRNKEVLFSNKSFVSPLPAFLLKPSHLYTCIHILC